jgi:hypothetical protein
LTRLRLYGTAGCHLCEDAEALVAGLRPDFPELAAEAVDIAGDDELLDRYGTRIPVLVDPASGAELGWPFDAAALRAFVAACCVNPAA